jgi:RNA polymerase sigma-70 factor, ECF subfamily
MVGSDPYRERSDEELALLAVGDPDGPASNMAACVLLERYTRVVYRWCYGRVHDSVGAEDLAQETLLRAYRNLNRFEGWGSFSAWLFVIARNVCIEKLRAPMMEYDAQVEPDALPGRGEAPDRVLEGLEDEAALLAMVREHLSQQEQDAIWLRYREGMPIEEITRVLGIRQATGARAVLQNARRKLRAASRVRGLEGGNHD